MAVLDLPMAFDDSLIVEVPDFVAELEAPLAALRGVASSTEFDDLESTFREINDYIDQCTAEAYAAIDRCAETPVSDYHRENLELPLPPWRSRSEARTRRDDEPTPLFAEVKRDHGIVDGDEAHPADLLCDFVFPHRCDAPGAFYMCHTALHLNHLYYCAEALLNVKEIVARRMAALKFVGAWGWRPERVLALVWAPFIVVVPRSGSRRPRPAKCCDVVTLVHAARAPGSTSTADVTQEVALA